MATTTKIECTASKYGNSENGAYTNNGRVYVAKLSGGADYRTRLTFPPLRSLESIGDANIVITKMTLHLRRDAGGPATVIAGNSADSAWGAVDSGAGSVQIAAATAWYEIDISKSAGEILDYSGNWYIHLSGSGTRVRCSGAGETNKAPYISVVWDYTANTVSTNAESVELGDPVTFDISPMEGDASYALSYEFGDAGGDIQATTGTSVTWTPPLALASEIPDSETGEAKITMKVYDAEGFRTRTEILYLTVRVPDSAAVKFSGNTFSVTNRNALVYVGGSALLAGKSHVEITPVLDINGAYGATVESLTARIENGAAAQTHTWASLDETDAGIFGGDALSSMVLANPGVVSITLTITDSRGREMSCTRAFDVYAYSNPSISAFSVERYEAVYDENEQITGYAPSDIGENVWLTLVASCANVFAGGAYRNFLNWKIIAKASDGTETVYSGGGTAQAADIINDRTIIAAAVPAASAVEYTLEVSDMAGYAAYQYDSVVPGRANFALAASKYGASFGCLPKGMPGRPMLETAYPFYAYAGIDGVTNYAAGEVKTGGKWIDGRPVYRNVIPVTVSAAGSTVSVAEISNLSDVIDIGGFVYDGDGARYPVVFFLSTGNYIATYIDKDGAVKMRSTRTLSGCIILHYTKATDDEGYTYLIDKEGNTFIDANGYEFLLEVE